MTENVSYNGMEPFENPDRLPLEELKLRIKTDGVVVIVNALNERWADDRYFLHYESPVIYDDNGAEIMGAKEQWLEVVGYIIDDLKWLLGLPFYRFWSNIVYNNSILDTLVSFLQEAPPFYALENFPTYQEMLDALDMLHRNVLVTFARLITNKESPSEYMNRPFHGKLLYDNYIFTIPIIFDLCQLFGRENGKTVEKILSSLFTLENLYNQDLKKAVPCLIEALENVEVKLKDHPVDCNSEAVSLLKRGSGASEMTLFQLEDMILYVLDISSTITVLLRNYPPAVSIFHREDFINKIVAIYENTVPAMYKKLDKLGYNDEDMPKYIELKHRLDVIRIELLSLFRIITYHPILDLQQNLKAMSEAEIRERVDDYINILSNAISEKEFITDYNQFYPVQSDITICSNLCSDIDTVKNDYVLQAVYATIGLPDVPAVGLSNNAVEAVAGPSGISENQFVSSSNNVICPSEPGEMASLISNVKDIFSDLDENFIRMCLKHYNNDTEAVINALLEDTLPSDLKELKLAYDRPLYIPPDDSNLVHGVERLNIYDDDDNVRVMTRKEIEVPKDYICRNYSLIEEDYDDEYDDTYEGINVRGSTQDDLPEMNYGPFTTPRVLRRKQKDEVVSDDESDEEEEDATVEQNGRNFVQNPEELRAKAEERRRSARGGKSNVVGNPKGQGQEKSILHNRQQKNTHKATRANHNRRSGASWKRQRGMIPS